jgi:7-carboxy-7-deazaguanine synthase
MTYAVKECFLTLQGEGVQAGSRAVFLRFAGCNLWSGREQDRATAQCNFCDTDFVGTDGEGGGKFARRPRRSLAARSRPVGRGRRAAAGGDHRRRADAPARSALSRRCTRAVSSRGRDQRHAAGAAGLDWICVSPKAGTEVVQRSRRRAQAGLAAGPPQARRSTPFFE